MTDYQKYINALRKCANEHENDRTSTGHIVVSDLCRDTANLLEELSISENPNKSENPTSSTTENDLGVDCVSRKAVDRLAQEYLRKPTDDNVAFYEHFLELPSVIPIRPKGHWIKQTLSVKPFGEDTVLCDQCAFMTDKDSEYRYCPNCGAKMSEVAEIEKTKNTLTNSDWIDFLSEQFDISRTSAKEMLHVMMSVKKKDNFKKQFSQG